MTPKPASAQVLAARLASLIAAASSDRPAMEELKHALGLAGPAAGQGSADPSEAMPPAAGDSVGIWKQRTIDGKTHYVRDDAFRDQFNLWARTPVIPPKGAGQRIVLVGESVARGYFFDPHYTPAAVLESLLNPGERGRPFEVIDLAKTGLTMEQALELCAAAQGLEPDALVLFAGNNWVSSLWSSITAADAEHMIALLNAQTRFEGLKVFLEERFAGIITAFLERIRDIGAARGIPVFFVIPEFNLLDWKSNPLEQTLLWPQGEGTAFVNSRRAAEQALQREDLEAAGALAGELIRLNGANPVGYELLAACRLRRQRADQALDLLKAARDAAMLHGLSSPRCYSIIRETLLKAARANHIHTVDLPAELLRHRPGQLPDRNVFMDYCHLSVEGIRIAMAATARTILLHLTGRRVSSRRLLSGIAAPGDEVVGIGHFFASLHNAHWGQAGEVVEFHCGRAVAFSAEAAYLMRNYMDMTTVNSPRFMSRSFKNIKLSGWLEYEGGIAEGQSLDVKLVDAMARALQPKQAAIEADVKRLRLEQHGARGRMVDLLESRYSEDEYAAPSRRYAYYQAIHYESKFFFISGGETPATLLLTYRTPQFGPENTLLVRINTHLAAELPASRTWCNTTIPIDANLLRAHYNCITLQWPAQLRTDQLELDRQDPLRYLAAAMVPVYGEVYAFCLNAG